MDLTVIILIIVLIVILYLFYKYFIASSSQVVSTVYLNKAATAKTITDKPTVVNFSVACWVYVNSWSTTSNKNIYSLMKDSGTGKPIMSLDLDKTAPTMTTTIYNSSGTPTMINVTDNFPLQRWVLTIVSVSNSIVDCYLDGRLISSFQLPTGTLTPADDAKSLTMNFATPVNGVYTPVDIFIYGVSRYAYGMDPGTAQNLYYYSSPPATSSNNYNVVLELEKDGQVSNSYRLF
jgi:hypothetical protein